MGMHSLPDKEFETRHLLAKGDDTLCGQLYILSSPAVFSWYEHCCSGYAPTAWRSVACDIAILSITFARWTVQWRDT